MKTMRLLLHPNRLSLENYLSYYPQKHLAMSNIASMVEILFLGPTMRRLRSTDSLIILLFNWCLGSNWYPKGSLNIAKRSGKDIYEYSWMDSCGVYFIDCSHGPGNSKQILRKNPQGQLIPFQVPAMIGEYNKFMGGVDVFDQVRKKNGNDVQHATMKYTVRMFEILWSMCLSQAYNVYRHVNKNRRQRQKNPTEFKIDVIIGLLNRPEVVNAAAPVVDPNLHILEQTLPGSKGDGTRRRKFGKCRGCPNKIVVNGSLVENQRVTAYHCTKCKVFFHPECFSKWHDEKGLNYVPSKQHDDLA
jgi:hypothetical protein